MRIREDYAAIGDYCINNYPEFESLREHAVKIAYLGSDKAKKSKGRITGADCNKVQDLYKWTCPYDFFIVVYEPNVQEWTDQMLETLIRHELLHVGITENEDGEVSYYIKPHDVEDFKIILEEEGLGWSDPYQIRRMK